MRCQLNSHRLRFIVLFLLCFCLSLNKSSAGTLQDSLPGKLFIRDIAITGNKVTKRDIILRELPFKTGDSIVHSQLPGLLTLAKQQLTNAALFNTIKLSDSVSGSDIFIKITLTERWYIFPELIFALADRNFNEWWINKDLYRTTYGVRLAHKNFRGRNERLYFDIVLGWQQSLGVIYKAPYVNRNKTIGLQFSLKHQQGHEIPYTTVENRLLYFRYGLRLLYKKESAEAEISYRQKLKARHFFRLGMERYKIDDTIANNRNPDFLYKGVSKLAYLYTTYQFVYDNRDYFYYPSRGVYLSLAVNNKILEPFSRNIGFYTFFGELNYFHPLSRRITYGTGLKIQRSSPDELPYIFRNSLGYRSLVRGYEHYVIDGNGYALTNNEMRFKLMDKQIHLPFIPLQQFNTVPIKLYWKIYADAGLATYPVIKNGNTFINKPLSGWGTGFDVVTYYDKILRIEYSFNNIGQSELFLHYLVAF